MTWPGWVVMGAVALLYGAAIVDGLRFRRRLKRLRRADEVRARAMAAHPANRDR